jgi:hypothetical protein
MLVGRWPRRMDAELTAAYCGKAYANACLKQMTGGYSRHAGFAPRWLQHWGGHCDRFVAHDEVA